MAGLNPQVEPAALTVRICRWCRREYRAPKGERWAGCRECAPTFTDALAPELGSEQPPAELEPPDDGIPF